MSLPIRTQTFIVTVSASIMPEMTEGELHNAVAKLAFHNESQHGMGYLGVHVDEISQEDAADVHELLYADDLTT